MKCYVITYGKVHVKDDTYEVKVGVAYDHKFVMEQADANGRVDYTTHQSNESAELAWRQHCHEMKKTWPMKCGMLEVQKAKYDAISNGEDLPLDGPSGPREEKPQTTLF